MNVKFLFENIHIESIVKGDSKYYSIAAASILAKEYHDMHIKELVEQNPEYNIKYDLLLGCGVDVDVSFETQFCNKYENALCYLYDGTVNDIYLNNKNNNGQFEEIILLFPNSTPEGTGTESSDKYEVYYNQLKGLQSDYVSKLKVDPITAPDGYYINYVDNVQLTTVNTNTEVIMDEWINIPW